MKIIYIHESIAYKGGLERIFVEKMNYLADKFQYEVYLLTTSQGDVPFSFPLSPQVRHIVPIPVFQASARSEKIGQPVQRTRSGGDRRHLSRLHYLHHSLEARSNRAVERKSEKDNGIALRQGVYGNTRQFQPGLHPRLVRPL